MLPPNRRRKRNQPRGQPKNKGPDHKIANTKKGKKGKEYDGIGKAVPKKYTSVEWD
jgi:hypothetical protein